MQLFDLVANVPDKPIDPQFELTAQIRKGFAFNNRTYQQGLFMNRNLEV